MKIFKYLVYLIALFISLVILYGVVAHILTLFPVNSNLISLDKNKTLYIKYNTMHSDIAIDIENSKIEWQELLPHLIKNRKRGYLLFGWGDEETYLNTPTWGDLKLSIALKALFINTPSLIHVTYYRDIKRYRDIKAIEVSKEQYNKIETKILESFGDKVSFVQYGYGRYDAFYKSDRQYNLIYTCNTWTGDTLRAANVTMSYWTPFSYNIIDSLQ